MAFTATGRARSVSWWWIVFQRGTIQCEGFDLYHVLLDLIPKSFNVLCGPIAQCLLEIPSCPVAQLASLLPLAKCALTYHCVADVPYAVLDERASGLALEPFREHVPPGCASGHLELEVAWAVDELEHRVRRIVPRPVAELVDARIPTRTRSITRGERLENLGGEGGLQEEACGFFEGGMRALLP